ncbi:MAG: methyl-accepting chemotaxis protein [Eubacterium sp.]|nr:methyl-accepting chemotaxis protein [Eubacterium sp.]
MISLSAIESCKVLAGILSRLIPGGVAFGIIEDGTIIWSIHSENFNLDIFRIGQKVSETNINVESISQKKVLTQNIPRSVYGKRLAIVSVPIIDDTGDSNSVFSIAFPKLHPVAAAFGDFAPILAEMFPEGSFIYLSDLEKIAYRHPSSKFDLPELTVGYVWKETDISYRVIKLKQPVLAELDESKYGIPVFVATYPLKDEENKEEIVATLGIITPKKTSCTLRDMASSLESGLSGISSAIEELAASATEIHTNEQELNVSIKDIISISDEINKVSGFIKEIADETKMLGLNAAIEAARAGENGRGFSVVAEQIRKLSDQSKSTVPKIKTLTENIKQKVSEAEKRSINSLYSSQEQASATEEITASIQEIMAMAEELNKISKIV